MISNFSAHSENESRLINCVQSCSLMVRSFSIQSGQKCNGKTSQMCIVHSLFFSAIDRIILVVKLV